MIHYDPIEELVKVTKTDIKMGKKSADSCPVVRALNRVLKIYGCTVVIDFRGGYVDVFSRRGSGKHHLGSIDLPINEIEDFRNKYWNNEIVEPFSFSIKFIISFTGVT